MLNKAKSRPESPLETASGGRNKAKGVNPENIGTSSGKDKDKIKKAKILIIDDEQKIREMLSFELGQQGYEVVTAQNGQEGIERTEREKFDLIILDVKMPGVDGMTVLKKFKEKQITPEVIIITGYGTIDSAVEALKLGVYDYITKPFVIKELKSTVKKCLEKKRLAEEEKKKKILVVDDNPIALKILKELLSKNNYKVVTADNGKSAIEKAREIVPDLMLLDVKLSDIDGWEVCRTLKKGEGTKTIPIIMITAVMTEAEHESKSLNLGADDYLAKPYDIKVLLTRIKTILSKAEKITELRDTVALYQISEAMSSLMELPRLLNLIFKLAREVVNADSGSITLLDSSTQELVVKIAEGKSKEEILGERIKLGERICGYAAKEKIPVLIKGPLRDDPRFKDVKEYNGIKSGMSIPMLVKNKIVGTINLKRTEQEDKFTEQDTKLISIFAQQASFAIENASLYDQLNNYSKELERKVKELEKFTDIAVGRELKMAVMEKEIEKLKRKISEGKKG